MKTLSEFWREDYLVNIMRQIESRYKRGLLRIWVIAAIDIKGDRASIKWYKLSEPLTDEEVKEVYGY
ncbi:hypothetical protein [Runella sp.]|uniref:hypothetical protein n=1 Tax=Runella sp. TaxID=1960881 RepID=UPI003D0D4BB2